MINIPGNSGGAEDIDPLLKYAEELAAYVDGEGSPEERAKFEVLMEQHPTLREECEQMRSMLADFEEESISDPDREHASDNQEVFVEDPVGRKYIQELLRRKPR